MKIRRGLGCIFFFFFLLIFVTADITRSKTLQILSEIDQIRKNQTTLDTWNSHRYYNTCGVLWFTWKQFLLSVSHSPSQLLRKILHKKDIINTSETKKELNSIQWMENNHSLCWWGTYNTASLSQHQHELYSYCTDHICCTFNTTEFN